MSCYLFPAAIKLICTAANNPLCLVIEERKPGLTSGIRDLDSHDVSEGATVNNKHLALDSYESLNAIAGIWYCNKVRLPQHALFIVLLASFAPVT